MKQCNGNFETAMHYDCPVCDEKKDCPYDRYKEPIKSSERIAILSFGLIMVILVGCVIYQFLHWIKII